ncbi:MAG: hypothetical protein ABSH02_17830 [Candidatus Sulfotelmatobacter sp.]|jgi:hypothetical protein
MTGQPQPISHHLAKRLLGYAVAAGAVTACSSHAAAEVIYTPANQSIGKNASLFIDLNHDGATDLTIHESCFATNIDPPQNRLVETPSPNLKVMEKFGRPGNLIKGTKIGAPHDYFIGRGDMVTFNNVYGAYVYGYWGFAFNRYLGVEFFIDGQIHYGWVRLTVNFVTNDRNTAEIRTHLSGYAYESDPEKLIIAGDEGKTANASAQSRSLKTLGLLALGAACIFQPKKETND